MIFSIGMVLLKEDNLYLLEGKNINNSSLNSFISNEIIDYFTYYGYRIRLYKNSRSQKCSWGFVLNKLYIEILYRLYGK